MSGRRLKNEVLDLLAREDLADVLSALQALPAKAVVNALFSAICRSEERVRWQAVSAMGVTVDRLAREELEEARIIMRRLLWSLNDESGGIGWGAPESMAEIMHHHQGLAHEYVHMLISYARPDGPEIEQDGNFLEHETLQQGLLWGFDRLCERRAVLLVERGLGGDIPPYLHSGDPVVRGMAARLCGRLGIGAAREALAALVPDESSFRLYREGRFSEVRVGELAGQALAVIERA